MQKCAYLIHGWDGSPDGAWRPWLKKELEKKGWLVEALKMPTPHHPKMTTWVEPLQNTIGKPDKNCYFIGHSLGCITILRYLESLKVNEKIGGVFMVAGFSSNLGYKELENFFKTPINWKKIKTHCSHFTAIHSDNDYYVSLNYGDLFKQFLNAKLIIKPKMGHFGDNDGITKLPFLLEEILRVSK